MGIFCGCLIFAEFCGSIEIAEIKNRKIFKSGYNDEIVSVVIVQSCIQQMYCNVCLVLLLNYLKTGYTQLYNVHLDMRRYLRLNKCCYCRL